MRTLALSLLMLLLNLPLTAAETDNYAGVVLEVGKAKVWAQFPKDVSSIYASPADHPTLLQATKGYQSLELGQSNDFDVYSIQVIGEAALSDLGLPSSLSTVDDYLTAQLLSLKGQYKLANQEDALPEELKKGAQANDRYFWVTGTYRHGGKKSKQFLWRLLLADGQLVRVQREIGEGYAEKNQVDPKNIQEWAFLQSVNLTKE